MHHLARGQSQTVPLNQQIHHRRWVSEFELNVYVYMSVDTGHRLWVVGAAQVNRAFLPCYRGHICQTGRAKHAHLSQNIESAQPLPFMVRALWRVYALIGFT